jgi:hypothetical protein
VRSIASLCDSLQRGGVAFVEHDGFVIAGFPSALGEGAWVFVETPDRLPWRVNKN